MSECHRRHTPNDLLNGRCPDCGHALMAHDEEIGCIVCDYKANIRDRVAHTVGPLQLVDERDVSLAEHDHLPEDDDSCLK